MILFLFILDVHPICSFAHSFQYHADLSMGSPSIAGGLPTEIGLLTGLGEYHGYRMVDKLHVEK